MRFECIVSSPSIHFPGKNTLRVASGLKRFISINLKSYKIRQGKTFGGKENPARDVCLTALTAWETAA
jgi:hypothetical protein